MVAGEVAIGSKNASWTRAGPDHLGSPLPGLLGIGEVPAGQLPFWACETERSRSRMTYLLNSARWGSVR